MTGYRVSIAGHATRQIAKLPRDVQPRVMSAVERLAHDPRPHGCVKLAGHPKGWRVRVGEYRVLYAVDDAARLVTVGSVAHRSEAYRA